VRLRRAGAAIAVLLAAAACSTPPGRSTEVAAQTGGPGGPGATAGRVELTVYAAASLRNALVDIELAYEAAVPGTGLTIATDSSATLRTQIEQGAPADVFLSADQANPRALVGSGLADGDAVDFAGNLLTIIVPADNPADLESPADLARPGIEVVAAGSSVPITGYAEQAVRTLTTLPGYPPDFAETVAANVVSREENVKAVVAKIQLGEGDAAIVYATDAIGADAVRTVEIPAAANVPAAYAGVVVGATAHPAPAHAFLAWLAGPEAAAILETFGFRRPT